MKASLLALCLLAGVAHASPRADRCDLAAIVKVQAQHAHAVGDSQGDAVNRVLSHLDYLPIAYGHVKPLLAYVEAVVAVEYSRRAHPVRNPQALYTARYRACMSAARSTK